MAIARDWLKTLWAASYKGTPFFVEKDDETGSRRIVEHEFPMRDVPYLEDLGEGLRHFQLTAYVASDRADSEASAVMQTCATRGPGVLVLPTHGPILVRCLEFERDRAKDKHGYIGHSLKFSREGASSALVSASMAANQIFIAADNAALAIAASFISTAQLKTQPDFVFEAASNGIRDAISALEAVRTSEPVDPVASSGQRKAIQSLFDDTPTLLASPDTAAGVPQDVITIARALGDALPADTAIRSFAGLATDGSFASALPAIYATPNNKAASLNADAARRLLRLAALSAYCEAIARVKLSDRPAGITLRANVAEFFEGEIDDLPASEIDLYHAICALRDKVIDYLSRTILDLAPVLTVEANIQLPSLYWAWRLYADPNRSAELVARNRIAHPSFMAPRFEALAK